MLGHRAMNVEDYLSILKRRWWIILIPAAIVPIFTVGSTYFLTPQYQSSTLVLIDQQKVPTAFVGSVVTEAIDSRLAYMNEQIQSHTNIEPIVTQYNLYGDQHLSMDARVDLTRKAIDIQPVSSDIARANGLPGFRILFTAKDPHTAQQVCAQITGLFTGANLKQRQTSAEDTTSYLAEEVDNAQRNLNDLDQKVAAFQRQYSGSLPGEEGTNLSMIGSLQSQLEATTGQLQSLEQNRAVAQTQLALLEQSAVAPITPPSQSPVTQEAELDALLQQQAELNLHYTPEYPEVKAIERKIADKRREIAKAASAPPPIAPTVTAPSHQDSASIAQVRAQLHGIDVQIQAKNKQQADITTQIRNYQGRLQSTPEIAAQYKALTRDYDTASSFYNQLLQSKNKSQMTTDLENQQKGENFTVLDAATLPADPIWPKQSVFASGGVGGGLFLGLLIVAFLEYKDTALLTERDVWEFTKLPTLAVIAWSGGVTDTKQPGLLKRLFSRKPKDILADASG